MSRNVLASVTLAGLTALIGAGAGYWLASSDDQVSEPLASVVESDAQVLYWYDPMVPQHRFEKPGKSPFMDMDLVPRYANEGAMSPPSVLMPASRRTLVFAWQPSAADSW